MNAGAFHLILTNKLGLKGESYVTDIERRAEVWNHLAYSYKSIVTYDNLRPRGFSTRGTVKMMRVVTTVDYTYVLKKNSWEPVLGTPDQKLTSRTYEYYLDINAAGTVIGGEWISKQRPDFMWESSATTEFTGILARLGELLQD